MNVLTKRSLFYVIFAVSGILLWNYGIEFRIKLLRKLGSILLRFSSVRIMVRHDHVPAVAVLHPFGTILLFDQAIFVRKSLVLRLCEQFKNIFNSCLIIIIGLAVTCNNYVQDVTLIFKSKASFKVRSASCQ